MSLVRFWARRCRGCADPSPHDAHLTWFGRWQLQRLAREDRAATVRLYGEERVAELEREANK